MIFKKKLNKKNTMEWKEYEQHIDFLDCFNFQQTARKQSIQNS